MLESTVSPPEKTGCNDGFICSSINAEITLGILIPAPRPTTKSNVHLLNHDNFLENLRSIKIPRREGIITVYRGDTVAAFEKIGTKSGSYKSGFRKLYTQTNSPIDITRMKKLESFFTFVSFYML